MEPVSDEEGVEEVSPPRRRLRLTRSGHASFVVTLALLACALNTGTNLIYLLTGAVLGGILLNALLVAGSLRGIRVRREAPALVNQGSKFPVRYILESETRRRLSFPLGLEEAPLPTWRLPSGPARIVFEGECDPGPAEGPAIWEAECQVQLSRLGANLLPPVRLVSRGPFGLFEETLVLELPTEIMVLPPCRPLRGGVLPGLAGAWDQGALAAEAPEDVVAAERTLVLAASCAASLIRSGASVGLALATSPAPLLLWPQPGGGALQRLQKALAGARPTPTPALDGLWERIRGQGQVILVTNRSAEDPRPLPAGLVGKPRLSGVDEGCYRLPAEVA